MTKERAQGILRKTSGGVAVVSFAAFWLFDFIIGPLSPSAPDPVHRFRFPYKPWVYLDADLAVLGYAILIALLASLACFIVLGGPNYKPKNLR